MDEPTDLKFDMLNLIWVKLSYIYQKKPVSNHDFFELEVNDPLDHRSSREVHAYDSKALVQVRLGLQVLIKLGVDAQSNSPGVGEHTGSAAVGEKNLLRVSCRCSLQVFVDTLPFLFQILKCWHLNPKKAENLQEL